MGSLPKPEQDKTTGRFVAGNSGNGGRPKGSRNKLAEAFLSDMLADWHEHGKKAISKAREEKPDAYLRVVASILPRDLNVSINSLEEASDGELIDRLRELEAVIRPFLGAEGGEQVGVGNTTPTTH